MRADVLKTEPRSQTTAVLDDGDGETMDGGLLAQRLEVGLERRNIPPGGKHTDSARPGRSTVASDSTRQTADSRVDMSECAQCN